MLFNLFLAIITILSCFFLLICVVLTFFLQVTIFFARLKLALAIPTNSPIAVANYLIEILPVVRDKAVNGLSK